MVKVFRTLLYSLVLGALFVSGVLAESAERVINKNYSSIDPATYAIFFESAVYASKAKGMYIATSYRNRNTAYIYASDANGQVKSYINMTYRNEMLTVENKITYDGMLPEGEAGARIEGIANAVLNEMESFSRRNTVRILNVVSIRREPSDKSERVALLKRGDLAELAGEQDKWYFVKTMTEPFAEGYVRRSFAHKR